MVQVVTKARTRFRLQSEPGSIAGGLTIKAHDVGQHLPKARRDEVASLRKHRGEARATPLKCAVFRLAENDMSLAAVSTPRVSNQAFRPVGAVIKNNKASVDWKVSALYTDLLGMGMATQTVVGFKDSDVRPR